MNSCDSESGDSVIQGEDKTIIDKILGEMKSEFNKTEVTITCESLKEETVPPMDSSLSNNIEEMNIKTENSTNENHTTENGGNTEEHEKPRIILSFKKPALESPLKSGKDTGRRSLRQKSQNDEKSNELGLKRSARRRSKDYNESVLQSAIARKEKSYNESNKPQRLTRQLKPTQKILENLALAKHEKTKSEKFKAKGSDKLKNDSDSFTEIEEGDRNHRKHKHKHHYNKHSKKSKRIKSDSSKDSDSDQSMNEDVCRQDDNYLKNSRRLSTSRFKDESNSENEDKKLQELLINDENSNSKIEEKKEETVLKTCLCTEKTQYYLARIGEETTYCAAVDTIGEKVIGCSKPADTKEVMLMRPSSRVPYTILCESHRNRLLRHNCCPICGVFCSQGKFLECEAKHHFHRDCQNSSGIKNCPHCGSSKPCHEVEIAIQSEKKPLFLPTQKSQYVSARMSFPNINKHDDKIDCVTPPLIPLTALNLQNSIESEDEEFELNDLISTIKSDAIEKIAIILGSKSVDINCKLPEYNEGTVLHLAAQHGQVSIVHMLLVAGAQPDVFDKDQNTPIMVAVLASQNDVVQYLIKTGASIDLKGTDGMTALHLAAKCGNLDACKELLRAAVNLKNYVNNQDDGGWTPLVWACEHGYEDVANFLIYRGADATLRDVEHNVALHWAAFSGSAHIANLLLSKGCDVNAVNAHGDTPLHIGARQDMYNCIIVLLARGADVTLLNKNNESPLDCVPPGGDSYSPIALNITLQASIDYGYSNMILSNDISKGRESNPIQCYNNIDAESQPTDFQYITKSCITSDDIKIESKITSLQCCECEERCVSDECLCGKLSVRCWYDEEGKLIPEFSYTDIPMIFECNDRCSCNFITCNNRVVQKGLSQRFELFKTADRGWGVRTLRLIPKGSFVCEYIGEIITDVEAERREDDSFLFDLENRVCRSASDIDTYCIDAKFFGNFARFINHSCSPNLTSVKVFIEHQDLRFPRIAFFANRDIASDEELSFDYGEKFWIAKYKIICCLCGSVDCKYSEDTIEITMQNYQRRLEDSG